MKIATIKLNKFRGWKNACFVFLFCAVGAVCLPAQTFNTLFTFNGTTGEYPGFLVQGLDGNFYGTASEGVASGVCQSYYCGTVFRITPSGALTTLHSFCTQVNCPDGQLPGPIVAGTDGNLYGITSQGGTSTVCGVPGCGTIFKVTAGGKFTTLYSFCLQTNCPDGAGPTGLMQAANGSFYGTTNGGGPNGYGTIFKITAAGTLTTLFSFNNTDGASPQGLVQATNGNFYGTTYAGGYLNCSFGPAGCGTVFGMTPTGKVTTLYAFCTRLGSNCPDGANPEGVLVQGADGNFYGTTYFGGFLDANDSCSYQGCGTIFKITSTGKFTQLYQFCTDVACADGFYPDSLIQATDGNFYGTASEGGPFNNNCVAGGGGCGTVFSITPTGTLNPVHIFDYTDGMNPYGIIQATNGTLYGATNQGGPNYYGTVYSLSVGLGPFVATKPTSGKVGAIVEIMGNNLTGTTAVTFNGVAAKFKVLASTAMIAAVPAGATTGSVVVTTPGGKLASNVPFQVTP